MNYAMAQKYGFDERPKTTIKFGGGVADRIKSQPYSCIIGPNNSGKSFVLRELVLGVGERASYLGPQRYNNFNTLAPFAPNNKDRAKEWFRAFRRQQMEAGQNIDSSPFNIQQAIAELNDDRRNKLFQII